MSSNQITCVQRFRVGDVNRIFFPHVLTKPAIVMAGEFVVVHYHVDPCKLAASVGCTTIEYTFRLKYIISSLWLSALVICAGRVQRGRRSSAPNGVLHC
jgi:hypothetical protein